MPHRSIHAAWLRSYTELIGPPAGLVALGLGWLSGWQPGVVAAAGGYAVFNIGLSVVELRRPALAAHWAPRGLGNAVALAAIYALAGDLPGVWLLALPSAFGASMAPVRRHARYVQVSVLTGMALGMAAGGLALVEAAVQLAGIGMIMVVTERMYEPLLGRSVAAQSRAQALDAANEELAQALAVRQTFLATMSHEIRTPMNGVLGMAELLGTTALDDQQREMLAVLQGSGRGLLQVLNDVLDISRLEAGRVELERLPTAVEPLAAEVIALLRHGPHGAGVRMAVEAGPLPPRLEVDPTRLRQVLLNLVGNAAKFTEAGHVLVRLGWAEGRLSVAVEDTGIGNPPAALARLFEPFSQADASTTRRFGGTGLGLAISHHLVALMGGELRAESTEGAGSTFSFSLPAPSAPAPSGPAPGDGPATADDAPLGLRVVVVDDNAVNLKVATAMLSRLGCRVQALGGGAALLAALPGAPPSAANSDENILPDAILLDCQMPGMDGFETCRRLRARGHRGPVLALTAGVTAEERAACAAAGMDDVLAKPVSVTGLRRALLAWTGPAAGAAPQG